MSSEFWAVGWVCTIHLLGSTTCASRRVHVMSNVCTNYITVCTTHVYTCMCTRVRLQLQLTVTVICRYSLHSNSYTHLFPLFPLLPRHLTPLHTHHFKIASRGTHTLSILSTLLYFDFNFNFNFYTRRSMYRSIFKLHKHSRMMTKTSMAAGSTANTTIVKAK